MTVKRFEIISLQQGLVAVDNKVRGESGWNYNYALKRPENLFYTYPEFSSEYNFCAKIVASSFPLEGIPLLPDSPNFEEYKNLVSLAEGYAVAYAGKPEFNHRKFGWIDGYKANKGKWNDEDLRLAFEAGTVYGRDYEDLTKEQQFNPFKQYLKSLSSTKQPIAVELEMEDIDGYNYQNVFPENFVPKVKDGKVIVRRWVFPEDKIK